jgi:hypothetical protein
MARPQIPIQGINNGNYISNKVEVETLLDNKTLNQLKHYDKNKKVTTTREELATAALFTYSEVGIPQIDGLNIHSVLGYGGKNYLFPLECNTDIKAFQLVLDWLVAYVQPEIDESDLPQMEKIKNK